MSKIDTKELRRLAKNACPEPEDDWYKQGYMELENMYSVHRLFIEACSPKVIIELLDELEELRKKKEDYDKFTKAFEGFKKTAVKNESMWIAFSGDKE